MHFAIRLVAGGYGSRIAQQISVKLHRHNPKNDTDTITAVLGIDLGDKSSECCVLDSAGGLIGDGAVKTSPSAFKMVFGGTDRMRIAVECGTHSPWVSRLFQELGHEVIVANPRLCGD